MPNYDYTCEKCHKTFEFFQSMKDEPLKTCPQSACCQKTWGKGKVKRQIGTGAGLIFKGSGFYITDYRSENYKSGAKSDTKSDTKSAEAAPAKTEPPKASPPPKSEAPKAGKSKPKASE
jgi:putative FmdB family regulatory protein